jgi:hypothetical protein
MITAACSPPSPTKQQKLYYASRPIISKTPTRAISPISIRSTVLSVFQSVSSRGKMVMYSCQGDGKRPATKNKKRTFGYIHILWDE